MLLSEDVYLTVHQTLSAVWYASLVR